MNPLDLMLWALSILVCLCVAVVLWAVAELAFEALRDAIAKRRARVLELDATRRRKAARDA